MANLTNCRAARLFNCDVTPIQLTDAVTNSWLSVTEEQIEDLNTDYVNLGWLDAACETRAHQAPFSDIAPNSTLRFKHIFKFDVVYNYGDLDKPSMQIFCPKNDLLHNIIIMVLGQGWASRSPHGLDTHGLTNNGLDVHLKGPYASSLNGERKMVIDISRGEIRGAVENCNSYNMKKKVLQLLRNNLPITVFNIVEGPPRNEEGEKRFVQRCYIICGCQ